MFSHRARAQASREPHGPCPTAPTAPQTPGPRPQGPYLSTPPCPAVLPLPGPLLRLLLAPPLQPGAPAPLAHSPLALLPCPLCVQVEGVCGLQGFSALLEEMEGLPRELASAVRDTLAEFEALLEEAPVVHQASEKKKG